MNILVTASELFPFYKTGGLADVAGALSQIFSRYKGNKVTVFIPKYKTPLSCIFSLKAVTGSYTVKVGNTYKQVKLFKVKWGNVTVYFIDNPQYFGRANFYGTKKAAYADNDKRFIFFNKAVLEGAKFINFKPDIIHCHDWQTGLIPAYLKTLYNNDGFFKNTKTLFTIHNLAHQGFFPAKSFQTAGFDRKYFTMDKLEYYGGINFLKSALVYADKINTVSPTYAAQAKTLHQIACGLEGVLQSREKDFSGILNGIDTEIWDPENDSFIPRGYYVEDFVKGKFVCKQKIQEKYNLTQNNNTPLISVISRLDYQKGLDLVARIIPLFAGKCQFAILGTGDEVIEKRFADLAKEFKGSMFFVNKFNETLAHNVYAGSDIFIMPSRFEPCGLSQMIALRYGTPVVANKTGGLFDTITGYGESDKANGFFMHALTEEALSDTLNSALICFHNKPLWYNMVKNAMDADFSWDKSAIKYFELFDKLTDGTVKKNGI